VKTRASQINGCAYCLEMHTRAAFTEEEIVNLTVAIGMINVWNRIAVSFRLVHPVTEDQRRSIA